MKREEEKITQKDTKVRKQRKQHRKKKPKKKKKERPTTIEATEKKKKRQKEIHHHHRRRQNDKDDDNDNAAKPPRLSQMRSERKLKTICGERKPRSFIRHCGHWGSGEFQRRRAGLTRD